MKTAIWWVRQDLRLGDNEALATAVSTASSVIPFFVVDPTLLNSPYVGAARLSFLWAGLRQLDADLRKRDSYLLVRQGNPQDELKKLVEEVDAGAIYAAEDFSPYARQRDAAIMQELPLQLCSGKVVQHPTAVLKKDGTPYTVFTPYSKQWRLRPLPTPAQILSAPARINTPPSLAGEPMPTLTHDQPFTAGESEAQRRLETFVNGRIHNYHQSRDLMALDGTSGLSPYLRLGMISPRQTVVAALAAREQTATDAAWKSVDTWLSELIWREFYTSILYHFPHVMQGNFRPEYDAVPWRNDETEFAAWCKGKTGYPVVDAAMRQLSQIGWMHNRARMITASFLVKDLLIDWRWGEKWFMQHLVDGDPAANNGGWQWTAGTGTDAAPYFRIFNPISQSQKFDPAGDYIRRWVPELGQVSEDFIHEPWKMPPLEQKRSGCIIGQDYPKPIVDHKLARQRTLDAYKLAKK